MSKTYKQCDLTRGPHDAHVYDWNGHEAHCSGNPGEPDWKPCVDCRAWTHHTYLNELQECTTCKAKRRQREVGKCDAYIIHGKGHQSRTFCSLKPEEHKRPDLHFAVFGSWETPREWEGLEGSSGFDDPAMWS